MQSTPSDLIDNELPNAMVEFLSGSTRSWKKLEHGWGVRSSVGQIAAGYVSDNAEGNAVELALNQTLLPEFPSERPALLRWLQYQRYRLGLRPYKVHQRGNPVAWFRIGFATMNEAAGFLKDFKQQSRLPDVRSRWKTPEDFIGDETLVVAEQDANRSNEELAVASIPLLISHVLAQRDGMMQPLTYEDLAGLLDRRKHNGKLNGQPMALGMGDVLARAMVHIDRAASLLGETLPYLTTIVVDKTGTNKGLPGDGVGGRWPSYPTLTHKEKIDRVELEYLRIMEYGRKWLDVLHVLQMEATHDSEEPAPNSNAGGRAGGESPEHKVLKTYISTHPELIGMPAGTEGKCEFALRSGDEIDVLFKSERLWVGVEVKASTSEGNMRDYERGLYQVIKYRSVLEAQSRIDHPDAPPAIRVVLALEMELPSTLRTIAKTLGIPLLEEIGEIPGYAIEKHKFHSKRMVR